MKGNIRIVSDGTSDGTRIEDAETGRALPAVEMVSWSISAETQLADAVVVFANVPCDIIIPQTVQDGVTFEVEEDETVTKRLPVDEFLKIWQTNKKQD